MAQKNDDFRGIVRIQSTDIKGRYNLLYGLALIKGMKYRVADFVCKKSNMSPYKKVGHLTDEEITNIEATIASLKDSLPHWMKNRKKDPETGKDTHLYTSDLDFTKENDIKLMKKIRTYKGIRHMFKLPLRGQKTRSNFRKHKKKIRKRK